MRRLITFLAMVVLLVACGQPGASRPTPPPMVTSAASVIPAGATPAAGTGRIVVMTHDSFSVSEEVLAAFTARSGISVEFLKAGDAGTVLNQAILSKNAPLADVLFGVDNTFLSRALAADILTPYASPALADLPDDLKLDPENRLLPVDFGYVVINYDKAALEAAGLAPPADLRDLTLPAWKGKLVVQHPATSSPGLAFLLATIGHFGETGAYTWKDFWRDLRANEVLVTQGWSEAYYTHFSGSSGAGAYPLVVSYTTSPAAEVFFSEGRLSEPPTGNLLVPGGSFRQIEFVGILRGARDEAAARQFVDFMLQPEFQADIPLQMFVYPANPQAPLPDVFVRFAERPSEPASLAPDLIEQRRDQWIAEWTEIVLR
jgi:thiamine transport system substrate-binding protein